MSPAAKKIQSLYCEIVIRKGKVEKRATTEAPPAIKAIKAGNVQQRSVAEEVRKVKKSNVLVR